MQNKKNNGSTAIGSRTEFALKYVLMGSSKAGKSELIRRFVRKSYSESYQPTRALEYCTNSLPFRKDCTIQAQIWDCEGSAGKLAPTYLKNTVGAMIVYDVTSKSSFDQVGKYVAEVKNNCHAGTVLLLVGNKIDQEMEYREVSKVEAQRSAARYGMDFVETSAKDNINVDVAFRRLIFSVARLLPPIDKEDKNPLPPGWSQVSSRSTAGLLVYENYWTGQRVQKLPKEPAQQQTYGDESKMRSLTFQSESCLGEMEEKPQICGDCNIL